MASVAFYPYIGRTIDRRAAPAGRAPGTRQRPLRARPLVRRALLLAALAGCAGCSPSDRFLDAQIDYQLRQGGTPTLDLARVGPANWTRACVLAPFTDDGRAAALLGFPWPAARLTSIDRRDDVAVLAFTDGRKVLAFVERQRAAGDFAGLQPPCVTRDAARLATRRAADGRLLLQVPPAGGAADRGAGGDVRSPP